MEESKSMLGADLMAACCVYFLFVEYNQIFLMLVTLVFDLALYGPMGFAMPMAILLFYKVLKTAKHK